MSEGEKPKYHRILLKLSGEVFLGTQRFGIDSRVISSISSDIAEINELGVEVAIVIGGGNFLRGITEQEKGVNRVIADYMGMLATVINSLALQDALEKKGIYTRVVSAIEMRELAEPYIRRRAVRHLEKGRVVILGAGTGNPYFTTDTAAALRAMEIDAELLVKATKVDGVYESDPHTDPDAKRFSTISYIDALNLGVKVLDGTALTLCMDNQMPIVVLNLWQTDSLKNTVLGNTMGTLITY